MLSNFCTKICSLKEQNFKRDLCEDIFVAAARKQLEYIIKTTYSNLVYSPYEPLYSFNTLVLLLNSNFVKTCFDALVLISSLMRTRASKHVFTKLLFSNNTNVLKEYKGSYGLYTRFE